MRNFDAFYLDSENEFGSTGNGYNVLVPNVVPEYDLPLNIPIEPVLQPNRPLDVPVYVDDYQPPVEPYSEPIVEPQIIEPYVELPLNDVVIQPQVIEPHTELPVYELPFEVPVNDVIIESQIEIEDKEVINFQPIYDEYSPQLPDSGGGFVPIPDVPNVVVINDLNMGGNPVQNLNLETPDGTITPDVPISNNDGGMVKTDFTVVGELVEKLSSFWWVVSAVSTVLTIIYLIKKYKK